MTEPRLPAHITEDDIRLIAKIIVPTIVAEADTAGVRRGIWMARKAVEMAGPQTSWIEHLQAIDALEADHD